MRPGVSASALWLYHGFNQWPRPANPQGLADQPLQIRLALSASAAQPDEVRQQIMPVNRKYPLAELLAACAEYQEKKRKMMTLEYILIEGVNDSLDQAAMLAKHARRLHAKVNLIPYNTVEGPAGAD